MTYVDTEKEQKYICDEIERYLSIFLDTKQRISQYHMEDDFELSKISIKYLKRYLIQMITLKKIMKDYYCTLARECKTPVAKKYFISEAQKEHKKKLEYISLFEFYENPADYFLWTERQSLDGR